MSVVIGKPGKLKKPNCPFIPNAFLKHFIQFDSFSYTNIYFRVFVTRVLNTPGFGCLAWSLFS